VQIKPIALLRQTLSLLLLLLNCVQQDDDGQQISPTSIRFLGPKFPTLNLTRPPVGNSFVYDTKQQQHIRQVGKCS
jgi:hypothetical protein